jgi:hypothetical protein
MVAGVFQLDPRYAVGQGAAAVEKRSSAVDD